MKNAHDGISSEEESSEGTASLLAAKEEKLIFYGLATVSPNNKKQRFRGNVESVKLYLPELRSDIEITFRRDRKVKSTR